jgi:hypothetical protein
MQMCTQTASSKLGQIHSTRWNGYFPNVEEGLAEKLMFSKARSKVE